MLNITEKPKVKLIGEDSNVFYLMGICSKALRDAGQAENAKEMSRKVMASKGYDEALHIMQEYCDVVG